MNAAPGMVGGSIKTLSRNWGAPVTTTDVLVVGGGGAGCSAALHLALRGAQVIVLERGQVGGQATGVNYGGVRQQGRHAAELPLARKSRDVWGRLPQLIGTDAEFEATGHLKLARTDAEEAELVAYLDVARDHGLSLRLVGRDALRAEYPYLGPALLAGSLAADDGAANPRLLTPALAAAARAAGAVVYEGMEVVSLSHDGQVFTVQANGRAFQAPWLLNCAGLWGGKVAEAFGEPVPIQPLAPNLLVTEPVRHFIGPNLGIVGGNVYLRQVRRGNIVFGGGLAEANAETLRSRPLPDVSLRAMALALQLVPSLADIRVIRSWTGIDGRMPDGIPVIGPSHTVPGLVHAFGFSGHGFQLGPGIGLMLSEMVYDGGTDVPLDAFGIARFAPADDPAPMAAKDRFTPAGS